MLKQLTFFLTILISFGAFAQNPVKWNYAINKVEGEELMYEIKFDAHIEDHWHMYSQDLPNPDEGPLATIFEMEENDLIEFIGIVEEEKEKMHSEMDPAFEVMVNYYDEDVSFTQLFRLKEKKATTVKGYLSFMVCSNTTCLPPEDVDFEIKVEP